MTNKKSASNSRNLLKSDLSTMPTPSTQSQKTLTLGDPPSMTNSARKTPINSSKTASKKAPESSESSKSSSTSQTSSGSSSNSPGSHDRASPPPPPPVSPLTPHPVRSSAKTLTSTSNPIVGKSVKTLPLEYPVPTSAKSPFLYPDPGTLVDSNIMTSSSTRKNATTRRQTANTTRANTGRRSQAKRDASLNAASEVDPSQFAGLEPHRNLQHTHQPDYTLYNDHVTASLQNPYAPPIGEAGLGVLPDGMPMPAPMPVPEPLDFQTNPDAIALRSTISLLLMQRQRAMADMQTLQRTRDEALQDPAGFVHEVLLAGESELKAQIQTKSQAQAQSQTQSQTQNQVQSRNSVTQLQQKQGQTLDQIQKGKSPTSTTSPAQGQPPTTDEYSQHPEAMDVENSSSSDSDSEDTPKTTAPKWTALPKPQNVVRCPPINWNQYAIVGESLHKLHNDQVRAPDQGVPSVFTPHPTGAVPVAENVPASVPAVSVPAAVPTPGSAAANDSAPSNNAPGSSHVTSGSAPKLEGTYERVGGAGGVKEVYPGVAAPYEPGKDVIL